MKFKFNQMMYFYKFYTSYSVIGIKVLKLSETHNKY